MTCTSKLQNNIRNGIPILDNPTKVLSFMFRTLLVLKLLKCPTPDGGHLGFVQYGRHRGSPSWLPREIGRWWSYLPLVQKWCLWNDVNNYLIKPPDYSFHCPERRTQWWRGPHLLTKMRFWQRNRRLILCRIFIYDRVSSLQNVFFLDVRC